MDLRSCQTSWLKVSQVVEPVQSSSLARYAGYLHDGLSHRQGLCPSPPATCSCLQHLSQEERQRLMRRNIVRYSLLSYCMCMRTVSFRVKKRFPDLQVIFFIKIVVLYAQIQHLVDAGLMRDDELKVLQDLDTKVFQSVPHKSRIFPIKIIPFSQRPHSKI